MASFWQRLRRMAKLFELKMGNEGRRKPRRLALEALEERTLLTATVYVDFGFGFSGGSLTISEADLARQDVNGVTNFDHDSNPMTPNVSIFGAGHQLISLTRTVQNQNIDLNGDMVANQADAQILANQVVAAVQRAFEPFAVNVVVRNAANINDVSNALSSTNTRDAYVFVAGDDPPAPANAFGWGPVNTGNTLDNTAFAFADEIIRSQGAARAATALARTVAHEAAHTFGLDHISAGSQLGIGEVMGAPAGGVDNRRYDTVNIFTRYAHALTDTGLPQNSYDLLGSTVGFRPTAYVTGTGGHDSITISDVGNGTALVFVVAFSDPARTLVIGNNTYFISTANGILVEGGVGDDKVTVRGNVGTVRVRGGADNDTLQVEGNPGFSTTVDFNQVSVGSTTVSFEETEGLTIAGNNKAVDVKSIRSGTPVTVSRASTATVGNGSLGGIASTVTIDNQGGSTAVTINGASDNTYRTPSLGTTTINGAEYGRLFFGNPGVVIQHKVADTISLKLLTGAAGAGVTLNATRVPTTIVASSLNTRVNVGLGSLSDIRGPITVGEGLINFASVTIAASNDNRFANVNLTSLSLGSNNYTQVSGVAGLPFIRVGAGSTSGLTLETPLGTPNVNVRGTADDVTLVTRTTNVVNVGLNNSLAGIRGDVTVRGSAGANVVNVNASADAFRSYVSDTDAVVIPGGGAVSVGRVRVGSTNINYELGRTGSVSLNTGPKSAVDVQAALVPLTVNGNGVGTSVSIGQEDSLVAIRAPITIGNSVANGTSVRVNGGDDDNFVNVDVEQVFIGQGAAQRSYAQVLYTGLPLRFDAVGIRDLTIATSVGASVNVLATVKPTFIESSGSTTVTIGDGTLASIAALVDVSSRVDNGTRLIINDTNDGNRPYVQLDTVLLIRAGGIRTDGLVRFDGVQLVQYQASGTSEVTLHTGAAGATVDVNGTATQLNLIGHADDTIVNVGNGKLGGIRGGVTITNDVGQTKLTVDGSTDPSGHVIVIDSVLDDQFGEIAIDGTKVRYRYDQADLLALHVGLNTTSIEVKATAVEPLKIVGHSDLASVFFGDNGLTNRINAEVTLESPFGFNLISFDNYSDPNAVDLSLGEDFMGLTPAAVTWDTKALRLVIQTGTQADRIGVRGKVRADVLEIQGGGGVDEVTISSPNQTLSDLGSIYVLEHNGEDSLYLDDRGELDGRTYVLGRIEEDFSTQFRTVGTQVAFHGTFGRIEVNGTQGDTAWVIESLPYESIVEFIGGTGDNNLTGPNVNAVYRFGEGKVEVRDPATPDAGVNFSGPFSAIFAGDGDDTFAFEDGAGYAGYVDGGAGLNALDYSDSTTAVSVHLPFGQATGVGSGVSNIRKAIGGTGDDLFVGDGNSNVFEGGDGNDVLIAGGAVAALMGGDGEDLLIGGSTSHDFDPAALEAIRSLWSADLPYADRVDNLLTGPLTREDFLPNNGFNFFSGGEDLDLYFGSKARDLSDYDADVGERFIDPSDVVEQGQVISIEELGASLNVDGTYYDTTRLSIELQPGTHYVYTQATVTYFTVRYDGTFDYDASLEGALTGRGTRNLNVRGRAVNVDVSALGLPGANFDGEYREFAGVTTLQFMPGQHYLYVQGTVTYFTVNADGTLDYDASLEGALVGSGTNSLTALGRAVNVDVSALGLPGANFDGVYSEFGGATTLWFMPGQHYLYVQNTVTYFTVNADGTIDYDASLEGALVGSGTNSLTALGRAVNVDVTGLGLTGANFDGEYLDFGGVTTLRFMPGQHYLYVQGTVTYFTVNADGTIDFDASLEGALVGRGTTSLTAQGRAVTVDVSALGLPGANFDGEYREFAGVTTLQFMPGQHYLYVQGTVTYFTVNADGTLDYDASLEGALSGRGTTSLQVNGRQVTLDLRVSGQSVVNVDGMSVDGTQPTEVSQLPGQHNAYVNGVALYYTVNADGTLDYDASLDGVFSGRGTTTLTLLEA